ncbi:MAG: transposase [Thermoanaerobaculia bacterium]
MRHDNFIPHTQIAVYQSRGRLPHWFVDHATYFVTFRLRDSLPQHVVRSLIEDRERINKTARNSTERAALERAFARNFDGYLDQGYGACVLREYGQIVADVLTHFDGQRFTLHAWCVMPNHVHVMFHVACGRDVPKIVQGWKSVSAHYIDKGAIWQREYFDRIVRSEREFEETREYIHANPTKAGLVNWPWVG